MQIIKSHPKGQNLKFQYSTVDDYLKAIKQKQLENKFTFPIERADFFPYNGYHPAHYWVGYFTSRPNFKKLIRDFTALTYSSNTRYSLDLLTADEDMF